MTSSSLPEPTDVVRAFFSAHREHEQHLRNLEQEIKSSAEAHSRSDAAEAQKIADDHSRTLQSIKTRSAEIERPIADFLAWTSAVEGALREHWQQAIGAAPDKASWDKLCLEQTAKATITSRVRAPKPQEFGAYDLRSFETLRKDLQGALDTVGKLAERQRLQRYALWFGVSAASFGSILGYFLVPLSRFPASLLWGAVYFIATKEHFAPQMYPEYQQGRWERFVTLCVVRASLLAVLLFLAFLWLNAHLNLNLLFKIGLVGLGSWVGGALLLSVILVFGGDFLRSINKRYPGRETLFDILVWVLFFATVAVLIWKYGSWVHSKRKIAPVVVVPAVDSVPRQE